MNAWQAALAERRRVLLGSNIREMGLRQRVPALLKNRGWPYENEDIVAIVCAAVVCKAINAGRTPIRRPEGAELCGGKWPPGKRCTASELVKALELQDLFH